MQHTFKDCIFCAFFGSWFQKGLSPLCDVSVALPNDGTLYVK